MKSKNRNNNYIMLALGCDDLSHSPRDVQPYIKLHHNNLNLFKEVSYLYTTTKSTVNTI